MKAKYLQYIELMLAQNAELFNRFRLIHDNFSKDPDKFREEYNLIGRDVQDVIRRYENMLCLKTESGGYSKYSTNLSEKFHQELKKIYPKVDYIGDE